MTGNMKHISFLKLILISNALIGLSTLAGAQFIIKAKQKLTITPSPRPTNGTKYTNNLMQKFNLTEINFLDLMHFKEKDADFFQSDSLSAFSELTRLTINSSNIGTLPEKALEGLPKLQYLNISFSGIREIPADLLHYTSVLQELILSHNEFAELPTNLLQNISTLYILDLRSNELVSLHREIFRNLKYLYQLYLNDNKLTTLNKDVFHDVGSRLMILDLSFNQIGFFDDQIFAKLSKLTDLLLVQAFSANVTTLPSSIFFHLTNAEVIKLNGNFLEHLPENIFHRNLELQTLSLANNKLAVLGDTTFQENTKLQSLYLNDNKLTYLSEHIFSKLTELRELHLENNQLSSLNPLSFSQLTDLQTIWISNNSVNMVGPSINISNLYSCGNIENIYAADNSITQIYDDWIQKDGKLKVLDLRSNPISESRIVPSQFLSDHVSIYLNDQDAAEVKLKKITQLEMNNFADKKFIMDKNAACGSNCACIIDIDYERERMVLKCVRFDENEVLENIPSHLARFASSLNVEVILSKCNLTSIYPVKRWLQQLNATKLSLSDNYLSHLDGLPELPRLKVLELHNNEFTSIDKKTLGILTRAGELGRISLYNNPWICECSSREFFDFLLDHHDKKKIENPNQITCDNRNKKPLLEIATQDLCYNEQTLNTTPTNVSEHS